ncbi:50S ribosomal protein L4 [Candidatus Woesearchaeota archaeon]|nr:50S ribosomal protein L4 [Candidatus Woesearchaeota archaeon]
MKLKIISSENKEAGEQTLPKQFQEEVRPDIIKKDVLAIQLSRRQPYGADPEAGERASADLSKRRRKYRGSYGPGRSRTPRKVMTKRGTQFNFVGAFAPNTVGGRRAHPPKAEKIIEKKINKKERNKAVRSAMASTLKKELVAERRHKVPDNYPFILEKSYEDISKAKDAKQALIKLGLEKELERASKKKIRAGKGKARGRKYRKKKGPLIIVSSDCKLMKSAKNIPGVEIVSVEKLNSELLAPGAVPGRLALFTKPAVEKLEKERLYI